MRGARFRDQTPTWRLEQPPGEPMTLGNVRARHAAVAGVLYYGVRSIPSPWSLVKGELDEHFGFPVVEKIEQANEYFRTKLHTLLDTA